jgi:hypothetical protein
MAKGLGQLTEQPQTRFRRQIRQLLPKKAIEPNGRWVVLEHQSRTKLRFSEVEHPEDPAMFDALKNAELAHGHPTEALALVGGGGAGVRINPDATRNSKTRMLCDEILPAISLTEQRAEEIVSDPLLTAGWPDTCLLA